MRLPDRVRKLEQGAGDGRPKFVVICGDDGGTLPPITRVGAEYVRLCIPSAFDGDDPFDALADDQLALIGPDDRVDVIEDWGGRPGCAVDLGHTVQAPPGVPFLNIPDRDDRYPDDEGLR